MVDGGAPGQMCSLWCHFLLANMRVQPGSRPRLPVNTTLNFPGYSGAGLSKFTGSDLLFDNYSCKDQAADRRLTLTQVTPLPATDISQSQFRASRPSQLSIKL